MNRWKITIPATQSSGEWIRFVREQQHQREG